MWRISVDGMIDKPVERHSSGFWHDKLNGFSTHLPHGVIYNGETAQRPFGRNHI